MRSVGEDILIKDARVKLELEIRNILIIEILGWLTIHYSLFFLMYFIFFIFQEI
jgi:hypothetical protein